MSVHFSSKTEMWATPQDLFDKLNERYHFTVDVCAIESNAKCKKYFSPEVDGLKQKWEGVFWMNPPYGKDIAKWVEKAAYEANTTGSTIVALLPARNDTRWFHNYIHNNPISCHYEFIKGRLKFGDAKNNAPFPSMIVVWNPITKPF